MSDRGKRVEKGSEKKNPRLDKNRDWDFKSSPIPDFGRDRGTRKSSKVKMACPTFQDWPRSLETAWGESRNWEILRLS